MLKSARVSFIAVCLALAGIAFPSASALAQTNYYNPLGTEYAVIGVLPGDQVFPDAAVSPTGGFLVWQDNITDGDSWGVSARRLDSTLSGTLGTFRVNNSGGGSQENPHVALLKGGGAVFVWQGGKPSYQHIYARFLNASNIFLTNDVQVNTFSNNFQINPAVAVLNNSNVVVVWGSFNQASPTSMQDVYGRILSPTGLPLSGEFLINQFTNFNQRTPSVAALPGDGFIVTWVSEQRRAPAPTYTTNSPAISAASIPAPSVDIYARAFSSAGAASGNEFLVNADFNPCATPSVGVMADGSYLIVWSARDLLNFTNSYDVYGRAFSSGGVGGSVFHINSNLYGDQYVPHVSALALDCLVTWTSLAQDGSREGVYARYVHNTGTLTGNEFRVNTTTVNSQMQACVASDGVNQFFVAWTGFIGLPNEFDLYAQRYANAAAVLAALPAPYVWSPFVVSNNVYQPRLVVSWAPVLGLSISNYGIYVDSILFTNVTTNLWTMTSGNGLTTNSARSFKVDYVLTDGRRSPISPSASGTTWLGLNWGGIPYEWMAAFFGGYFGGNYTTNFWPPPSTALAANTTLQSVFVEGGNPLDPNTWLKQQLSKSQQGLFLSWNTQPGAMYQVQVKTSLNSAWTNLGSPRFAAGTTDSIYVGGGAAAYYRLQLLR